MLTIQCKFLFLTHFQPTNPSKDHIIYTTTLYYYFSSVLLGRMLFLLPSGQLMPRKNLNIHGRFSLSRPNAATRTCLNKSRGPLHKTKHSAKSRETNNDSCDWRRPRCVYWFRAPNGTKSPKKGQVVVLESVRPSETHTEFPTLLLLPRVARFERCWEPQEGGSGRHVVSHCCAYVFTRLVKCSCNSKL